MGSAVEPCGGNGSALAAKELNLNKVYNAQQASAVKENRPGGYAFFIQTARYGPNPTICSENLQEVFLLPERGASALAARSARDSRLFGCFERGVSGGGDSSLKVASLTAGHWCRGRPNRTLWWRRGFLVYKLRPCRIAEPRHETARFPRQG